MSFYTLTGIKSIKGALALTLSAGEGEEKEHLLLTQKSYEKLGAPKKGALLSEQDTENLRLAHRRYEAVRRALSILAFSDNSEAMLYRKLCARKIAREDAAFALAYVKAKGLIREREQLERLVLRMANEKFFGRTRIVHALCQKGYCVADIQESIDALLADGLLDFEEIKRSLYEKKKPKNEAERQKLAHTHGFTDDF